VSYSKTLLMMGALVLAGCKSASDAPDKPGLDAAVKGTQPLAYYRLNSSKGSSEAGGTSYEFTGGTELNGKNTWIKTTQMGGIEKTGSIMAWVRLAVAPKDAGHILYVAGESQSGNDFDLQFEQDNNLRFFTGAGGNVAYAPDPGTLVNQWHMIVATMDAAAPARAIYWDGKPAAADHENSNAKKTGQFTIGESPVFTGRFFNGGIKEVALWDRALSAAEVAALYKAAHD
jgi:hypothetical protein